MPRPKNKKRSDGRLQAKVYLGAQNGKAKYKYVYASTQKELDAKVMDIKVQLGKGLDVTANNDKFGYWRKQWLKLKQNTVSAQRYISYTSISRKLEPLDESVIIRLTVSDMQNIIFDNAELSPATLQMLKSAAKQIFQLAIDSRIMDYNPANNIKIPKKTELPERRALTEEERQWIIDTPDYMQTAAMIMTFAGLRRGELLALLWTDIDLDKRTITVCKAAEVIQGKFVTKQMTKTEAGMRVIYIPQLLADYLRNVDRRNNLYVCPAPAGGSFYTHSWNRKWDSYIAKLNRKYGDFSGFLLKEGEELPIVIPHFTAHWCRHTFITMLYLAGVDVLTAKVQAGHNDIRTTMSIYTHLDNKFKQNNMSKLDDFLGNGCQQGVSNIAK